MKLILAFAVVLAFWGKILLIKQGLALMLNSVC